MDKIDIDLLAKGISKELKGSDLFDVSELENSLKESKLDFTKQYDKPIALIQMIEDNGIKKDILTTSNISCTIGGAKSKKTFFATMIISSLLGCKEFAINGDLQNLKVVLFDTEQAHYHVQKISSRVKKLVGNLIKIEIFALRPFMPEKRLAMIEHYLKMKKGKYSFVIIDGIVDLLYDFNDLHESKTIATKLMEWSANYNCHINTILHTNKDNGFARGHLGAELMNKSETVFRITKEDQNVSIVNCEMSRNAGFNEFRFGIDENGLPVRKTFPTGFHNNTPIPHERPLEQLIDYSAGLTTSEPEF